MPTIIVAAIVIVGTAATAISISAPAQAGPNVGPCGSTIIPICSIIPVMPELDDDLDLTQDPHGHRDDGGGDLAPDVIGKGG